MAHEILLSVVIAVYDERENLAPLHTALREALEPHPWSWEAIYVDDGSTDGSDSVLRELARSDDRIRVLRLDANHGQTAAWDAGFHAARGELVATLDADLQNDPADLPAMIARLSDGDAPVDVVCGVRARRRDNAWRRLQSRIGNAFRTALTGRTVQDTGCSLRVMRKSLLDRVILYAGMHRFLPTLLAWEGARIAEQEVRHHERVAGRSKYGMRNRALTGLKDLLAVRWLRSRRLHYRVEEESGG